MKPLRVLHVCSGNLFGGVETFLVTLARCRSHCPEMEPSFALCFSGRLEKELQGAGAVIHHLGGVRFRHPWTVWRARSRLLNLLRSNGFDVVVCHQPWGQAMFGSVATKAGLPYVAYFHGPSSGGWVERLARLTRPALIVAPSQHTLLSCGTIYPGVKAQVLNYPLPHSLSHNNAGASDRARVRDELGAKPMDVVVLQASRLERWKGPDILLRALAQLSDLNGLACWLAGGVQKGEEAVYLDELRDLSDRLGLRDRVRFLGERGDVPALMTAADVYCQGNRGPEGFSLAFLEACYCGLPVVTSDLGGAREMIDDSCGRLVPPEDPDALATALRQLIIDPGLREVLSEGARKRAVALCDTRQQVRRLQAMLADAA